MMKFVEKMRIRWQLMFYDVVIYAIVITFIVTTYGLAGSSLQEFTVGATAALLCLLVCRTVGKVYSMIIRYGGVHVYMRLFATDLVALCFYWPLKYGLGLEHMTGRCGHAADVPILLPLWGTAHSQGRFFAVLVAAFRWGQCDQGAPQ